MSDNTTPTYSFQVGDADSTVRWFKIALWIGAILSIIIGIIVLIWPGLTLQFVAILLGLYFIVVGIVRIVVGIVDRGLSGGRRALGIILGVLLLLAGVFTLIDPGATLVVLALFIGISWIIEGIITLTQVGNARSKAFPIVFGILGIIAGLVFLFVPLASLAILTIIAAWTLIVLGVVQAITALTLKAPTA